MAKASHIRKGMNSPAIVRLNKQQTQDAVNLATGVFAPLTGFLKQADYTSVLNDMRLVNGSVWTIPVVLHIDHAIARAINGQSPVLLCDELNNQIGYILDPMIFPFDHVTYAKAIFGTLDTGHPGVKDASLADKYLIGGEVVLTKQPETPFAAYNHTPEQIKQLFQQKGWHTIVGFQTRNVPHRGHEFLQKAALKVADGLLIQPVVGKKKIADFKDEYILAAYKTLIKKHFPENNVLLSTLSLKMHYAGPREAVFHALIRRNFGCTHFVVGRDHAGVGNYYPPHAAQLIFDQFTREEMGIGILKYEEVVYNTTTKRHDFISNVPSAARQHFSGTKLRQYVSQQIIAPSYLVRPEVAEILCSSPTALVEHKHNSTMTKPSFTVWFTGLSASGKSTIADSVYQVLTERQLSVERLDGDVVRQSLTKDLGFSREDRIENIKRIGFVASLLNKNGIGVIASFITPYEEQRKHLRKKLDNYIEIFISTPLETCEERDPKGLYKKARTGEIAQFTGISDPYEIPKNPDLTIDALDPDPTTYVNTVIDYLSKKGFLE